MLCPICNAPRKQNIKCQRSSCFAKTCGNKLCISTLRKQTNLIKYGSVCNLHAKTDTGETIQHTIIKHKYGVDNISQLKSVKEKKMKTCQLNHGVPWPMQAKEVMDKSKKTLIDRYGQDNFAKTELFKDKFRKHLYTITANGKTNLENRIEKATAYYKDKYDKHLFQTHDFIKNNKEIMTDLYDVDNYFKSKAFNESMIERGIRYNPDELFNREHYYSQVWLYTRKSYNRYKTILELEYKRSINYHLDHIYSISAGFKNNINPKIIGSICNLQILDQKSNKIKGIACWITLDELNEEYEKLQDIS